jgi:hypothetical protein
MVGKPKVTLPVVTRSLEYGPLGENFDLRYPGADKEIQSHQILHVVLQKGLPRRRRQPLRSEAILLHRRFGHLDAQLAQLADDPWRAPQVGLICHIVRIRSRTSLAMVGRPG